MINTLNFTREEFERKWNALKNSFPNTICISTEELSELNRIYPSLKRSDYPKGAKNAITFDGQSVSVRLGNDGLSSYISHYIMRDIKKVSVITDKCDARAVVVEFSDNTSEKAVVSGDDPFTLEQGISICIAKKLISEKSNGQGCSIYNKIIKHAMKVYDNDFKEYMRKKNEEERAAAKKQKVAEKKAARKARREAEERERLVSIQTEAYLRAMREYGKESMGNVVKGINGG